MSEDRVRAERLTEDRMREQRPETHVSQTYADHIDPEPPRFLSRDTYLTLLNKIQSLGVTNVGLTSTWRSDVRWGRNRITKAGDWRDVTVSMQRGGMSMGTNQTDTPSLEDAVAWGRFFQPLFDGMTTTPVWPELRPDSRAFPAAHLWSETTYTQTQDTRVEIAERLIDGAEQAGMLSAGYLSVEAQGYVFELANGLVEYIPVTRVQCSMTVRDPAGTGSGWAGRTSYDWARIGAEQLAATALDKCLTSRNPVRIEPGRYTLIMEPQATFEFIKILFQYPVTRNQWIYLLLANNLAGKKYPFHETKKSTVAVSQYGVPEEIESTKLHQRVFSEQVNLHWDPLDPDLGAIPFNIANGRAYPVESVQWVTNGVLTALNYPPGMSVEDMRDTGGDMLHPNGVGSTGSFRMDSGTIPPVSIDEMIATTKRGLLVTRFWNLMLLDQPSSLMTGTTRDGLWLIENGKISHPVRNLRWTESPLFALNQVEQIGTPIPIFAAGQPPAVTPALKVRDFSFTALEDAV